MGYDLGQLNWNGGTVEDNTFMKYIQNTSPGVVTSAVNSDYIDQVLIVRETLLTEGKNYYFHGYIKQQTTAQTFNIKLMNDDAGGDVQFIKTVTLEGSANPQWIEVNFVFSPFGSFSKLLFELQRTEVDAGQGREALIIYDELSEIKNLIGSSITEASKLIKIGMYAKNGLTMCINGEEISIRGKGLYEIKNGVMTVSFVSVVAPSVNANVPWSTTECISCTDGQKTRTINSFSLDYMYKTV